ncbi:MAG: methyltransferase [Ferruginibacter sp.]
MKSVILVILQFALTLLLAAGTNTLNHPPAFSIFLGISFLLMVWAVAAMKQSGLRIMPDPHLNAVLITNGPYRYIRHPMYTAVLCGGIALLFANFSLPRLGYWAALALVLVLKLLYEEKMLSKKFENYTGYAKNTCMIIPFIF